MGKSTVKCQDSRGTNSAGDSACILDEHNRRYKEPESTKGSSTTFQMTKLSSYIGHGIGRNVGIWIE